MLVSLNLERSSSSDLAIMIDALRASTTIITALEVFNTVIPVKDIPDAVRMAEEMNATLAGERGGARIEGFPVGNSPVDIKELSGDVLVLTTTNGTRVLEDMAANQAKILVGSFINAEAVAKKAVELAESHIDLVMAGVNGQFVIEDFLGAGEIISRIEANFKNTSVDPELDEMALAALMASQNKVDVDEAVRKSRSARGLVSLGLQKDVEFSLQRNIYNIVPTYKDGLIKKT